MELLHIDRCAPVTDMRFDTSLSVKFSRLFANCGPQPLRFSMKIRQYFLSNFLTVSEADRQTDRPTHAQIKTKTAAAKQTSLQ